MDEIDKQGCSVILVHYNFSSAAIDDISIHNIKTLLSGSNPFRGGLGKYRPALMGSIATYYKDKLYIVLCYGTGHAIYNKMVEHNIVDNKEMKKFITKLKKLASVHNTYIICVDTNQKLLEHLDLNNIFFLDFFSKHIHEEIDE